MFVAFEGIDGSGKSEVSTRVADALGARDLDVCHVRPAGQLSSPLAEQIRAICRDREHLSMAPITELLLCAAREAQLLSESIAPELARRDLVISDRSMHSWRNLAVAGRGVDPSRADAICEAAAGGRWPDLVILLDSDPGLARARRKAHKIARRRHQTARPPKGRKSLAGVALQHRLRRGYLELARRGGDRWLVIDNGDLSNPSSLDELVDGITETIAARSRSRSTVHGQRSTVNGQRSTQSSSERGWAEILAGAADRLFALIDRLAANEPDLAAYLTSRLASPRAHRVRRELLDRAPANVAASLRGLGDDEAFAIRERLIDRVPEEVARSLGGLADPRAAEMRERLAPRAPREVLGSIAGDDSAAAAGLRDHLAGEHPAAALASIRGLDTPRAWALRRRHENDVELAGPLASSLRGLDTAEAWSLREALATDPIEALRSVGGLDSERAWQVRERIGGSAPRVLFLGLVGLDSERAWALRDAHVETVKEVLDSLAGLDSDRAWQLRARGARLYPSTAIKSMLSVAPLSGERATLAASLISDGTGNVSLLRHATRLAEIERPA